MSGPVALPPAMTLATAVDLAQIMTARAEQIGRGYTEQADDLIAPEVLASKAIAMASGGRDLMHEGDRQNLEVAYARCARSAALLLATMGRIRRMQSGRDEG
jgi:hypothetical protein